MTLDQRYERLLSLSDRRRGYSFMSRYSFVPLFFVTVDSSHWSLRGIRRKPPVGLADLMQSLEQPPQFQQLGQPKTMDDSISEAKYSRIGRQ